MCGARDTLIQVHPAKCPHDNPPEENTSTKLWADPVLSRKTERTAAKIRPCRLQETLTYSTKKGENKNPFLLDSQREVKWTRQRRGTMRRRLKCALHSSVSISPHPRARGKAWESSSTCSWEEENNGSRGRERKRALKRAKWDGERMWGIQRERERERGRERERERESER